MRPHGLHGLPRRVYSESLVGDEGAAWSGLATMGAIGGVVLFLSAMAFVVVVVVATWIAGRKIDGPAFEFAVPLEPVTSPGVWDRLGMWTIVGIVFVILA